MIGRAAYPARRGPSARLGPVAAALAPVAGVAPGAGMAPAAGMAGAAGAKPETFRAPGRAEIARNSAIGVFLRAK